MFRGPSKFLFLFLAICLSCFPPRPINIHLVKFYDTDGRLYIILGGEWLNFNIEERTSTVNFREVRDGGVDGTP